MSNYTNFAAVRAGLGSSLRQPQNDKYVVNFFDVDPVLTDGLGGAAVTTDVKNNVLVAGNTTFQAYNENTNAAVATNWVRDDAGYKLVFDAASADGVLLTLGRTLLLTGTTVSLTGKGAFKIGTDANFFVRLKLMVADVSDTDICGIGFAVGAPPDAYTIATETDMAFLNIVQGDVFAETRLNSGTAGATDTGTNVIDDAGSTANAVDLEVRVSNTGVVKFLINGAAPATDVTGFTFDDGDVVHATFACLANTTSVPTVTLLEWESGFLSSRGLDSITDVVEASNTTINA